MKMLNVFIVWKEIFKLRHFRQHFTTFVSSIWLLYTDRYWIYIERNRYGNVKGKKYFARNAIFIEKSFYWRDKIDSFFSFHSPLAGRKSTFCHIRIGCEESLLVCRVHSHMILLFYHFIFILHFAIPPMEQINNYLSSNIGNFVFGCMNINLSEKWW